MKKDMLILFQGDSITDSERKKDNDNYNGHGYMTMVAGELGAKYAKYTPKFMNRAYGGDRSVDMLARWKKDCVNLKPDILSIMIGINDVGHHFLFDNGVTTDRLPVYLDMMVADIREVNPDVKLVFCGQMFVPEMDANGKPYEWKAEIDRRTEIVREAAERHGAIFVPIQERVDEALKIAPPSYWSIDGVHPTAAGHRLYADAWIEATKELFE